jgi:predicted N-acetyltransferase YhbS
MSRMPASPKLTLRKEVPGDYETVEALTREAFWNHYVPGCDEHYLMHVMREAESFLPELDYVAEVSGEVVGSIVYTRAVIELDRGGTLDVLSFGPLSVLPAHQGKGIGGALVEHTLYLARGLGHRAVLIYGDPLYYSRFLFVPAETYKIGTRDNFYAPPLQAFELVPGALSDAAGRFVEDEVYSIDPEASKEFDKRFPYKEKLEGLPSQVRFLELIGDRRPR